MTDIPIMPGDPLSLSEDDLTLLGAELSALIDDLEHEQSPFIDNIAVWLEWLDAIPASKRRVEPWDGASNAIVPMIKWMSDAVHARKMNTLFAAQQFWLTKSKDPAWIANKDPVEDFMNWAADNNDYDLFMPSYDVLGESVPLGSAVLGLNWVTRKERLILPGPGGKPRVQDVTLSKGPLLEHIPREQILWSSEGSGIQDADLVVRQSLLPRSRYTQMSQLAGWDEQTIEDTAKNTTSFYGHTSRVRSTKRRIQGLGSESPSLELHDIRECWVQWPMLRRLGLHSLKDYPAGAPMLPLVVTLHKDSRRVLRVIAKPYLIRGWPFFEFTFRRQPGRLISGGICKMLEQLQRVASTLLNQAIDTVTIANSLGFITTDPKMLEQVWSPNRGLLVDNLDSFREITLNKLVAPDISLLTGVMAMGERIIGINDPSLGREIRMGGHPSPATSTLTMLAESKEVLRTSLAVDRATYARMGETIATLYQQFEVDEDKIVRAVGGQDAEQVREWLFPVETIPGRLSFDVRALSETLNPDQERQKALLVSQVTANYFSKVLQGIQAIQQFTQTQNQAGVQAVQDALRAFTASHKRFLEASDIEDTDTFLAKLQESNNDRRVFDEVQRAIGDRLGQVQADTGQQRLPPVPTSPDGIPLGLPGTASPSGFQ